jgi:Tc toxin complex TcA C-terminal TcB-binding domain
MTMGTHQGDGAATGPTSAAVTPLLPAAGALPPDVPPSVTVRPLPGGIVAGSPVAVEVAADEGRHWFRDPTVVALTSPINATGVFELDVQSDLLLPFESSGVDTTWELRLPPAANPLDFSSIVDVLFTVEYTALSEDDYRRQVVTRLNADRDRGADRVFSLAQDFPDAWYDLNNPADPTQRQVTLTLREFDFPLGIDNLATAAVAVRLVGRDPVPDTTLTLRRGPVGGDALTSGGIASTRRGAAAWVPLVGPSPASDWQLGFGADADALFASGALEDVVLVVGWVGRSPAWEV